MFNNNLIVQYKNVDYKVSKDGASLYPGMSDIINQLLIKCKSFIHQIDKNCYINVCSSNTIIVVFINLHFSFINGLGIGN